MALVAGNSSLGDGLMLRTGAHKLKVQLHIPQLNKKMRANRSHLPTKNDALAFSTAHDHVNHFKPALKAAPFRQTPLVASIKLCSFERCCNIRSLPSSAKLQMTQRMKAADDNPTLVNVKMCNICPWLPWHLKGQPPYTRFFIVMKRQRVQAGTTPVK
ncbi:unnamed protein product [Ixodes pacificus]